MKGLCGGVVDQGEGAGYCCGVEEDFLAEFGGKVREERKRSWLWGWRHHVLSLA